MARLPRFVLPGHPQHVIQRGNNRQVIFCAESDYQFYLEKLSEAAKKHSCDIHAYVLMTNHVHLLVTPDAEDGISKMMQVLGRYYVQYFNYKYKRTGTLWEGRYKASLIDSEHYLLTCMRYIELNPVRAEDMVNHPSEYHWSSYRHNALGIEDKLVIQHSLYKRMGAEAKSRELSYQSLFEQCVPDKTIEDIREATNKAWILGNEYFVEKINSELNRQAFPKEKGGDRKSDGFNKINRDWPHWCWTPLVLHEDSVQST